MIMQVDTILHHKTMATISSPLPRITIQFCTQCKWMLRAAVSSFLLSKFYPIFTFSTSHVSYQKSCGKSKSPNISPSRGSHLELIDSWCFTQSSSCMHYLNIDPTLPKPAFIKPLPLLYIGTCKKSDFQNSTLPKNFSQRSTRPWEK